AETFLATGLQAPDPGTVVQSGSETIALNAGDIFCFRLSTPDNFFGSSVATITNFTPPLNTGDFASTNWTTTATNSPGTVSYTGAMATDNCGVDFSTLAIDGSSTWEANCGNIGVNSATITLSDINGNEGNCVVSITVEDNTAPTFTNVPMDVSAVCGNVPSSGTPTANDNCSTNLVVVMSELSTQSGNPSTCSNYNYTVTRTWSSTDDQGNMGSVSQVITVVDMDPPVSPTYADNINPDGTIGTEPAACYAEVSLSMINLVDCAPYANLTITNDSPFAYAGGSDASGQYPVGTHNVNFTVSDPCGNTTAYNQVFTVIDDVSPIAICKTVTLGLPSNGSLTVLPGFIDDGSIDNCGNIVSYSVSPNAFDCSHADGVTPWPISLTVVDDSGNSATCSTTIIIQENFSPTAVCQDITIELDANSQASITASDINNGSFDNCTNPGDLVISVSQTNFTEANVGLNTVTLSVQDINGNVGTCTATVTVEIPETCFAIGTESGPSGTTIQVPITVTDFVNVGSFQFLIVASNQAAVDIIDVATTPALGFGTFSTFLIGEDSIRVSYTVPQTPYMPLTLADGTSILEIEVFLSGNVGDFSFLEITDDPTSIPSELIHDFNGSFFPVSPLCEFIGGAAVDSPPNLFISGDLFTENGDPIAVGDVTAYNLSNISVDDVDVTGNDGMYNLGPVLGGDTYEVIPAKDTNWTNGVTAFDLGKIQQHVVGFDTLESVYKKIAADAFRDFQITTFDILQLQVMLASTVLGPGNLVTPPSQTSWVFVHAIDTPAMLQPLFVPPYTETVVLPALAMDTMGVDFIGIKIGDVTGNANPLTLISNPGTGYIAAEGRGLGNRTLTVTELIADEGDRITIPIFSKEETDYLALQWAFDVNTDHAKVVGVKVNPNSGLDEGDIHLQYSDQGKIVVIGFNEISKDLKSGEYLFEIELEATTSFRLSDILTLDDANLDARIFKETGDAFGLDLEFDQNDLPTGDFALMQNQPNPFIDMTSIGFVLPEEGEAKLTITDVAGKVLKVIEGDYPAGYSKVELLRSELPMNGVLFYTLRSGEYKQTKTMTLVE
ncbi:MAG: hypothetical protein HKN16_01615, partial [Saprospiraceae bacterium]|nr:hypothetical protein [Saprospiraceae bacterium]